MKNKKNLNKPRWTLVPTDILNQIVRVFDFGAKKYDVDAWMDDCYDESTYLDAAFRHIHRHRQGYFLDKESRLPHLAHAITNLIMALWHSTNDRHAKRKTV